jgi:plasmid maintenance system antidote protein VapI
MTITAETALQLERVLGVPASFWNNREAQYRDAGTRGGGRLIWPDEPPHLRKFKAHAAIAVSG